VTADMIFCKCKQHLQKIKQEYFVLRCFLRLHNINVILHCKMVWGHG